MAEEIRIIKGDTYDIEFRIIDGLTEETVLLTGVWNIAFYSDFISKNSVADPTSFQIETGPYEKGEGVVHLWSNETNPQPDSRKSWCNPVKSHYKLICYKNDNPAVVKTVSSGDLIYISEV